MQILVITFQLDGMSKTEFTGLCDQLAPTWAEIPGLISKVWLSNPETNTYGGVYTWTSRDAMQAFLKSELFDAISSNPNFANASADEYAVLEAPTRVTRGMADVVV